MNSDQCFTEITGKLFHFDRFLRKFLRSKMEFKQAVAYHKTFTSV